MRDTATVCHVCHKELSFDFPTFKTLKRAASDCKPWPSGGSLSICDFCGVIQKCVDPKWEKEVAQIYENYNLYHQSPSGNEQPVFDQLQGNASPRSRKILDFAITTPGFPLTGKMLDVGCGNGAMLKAFSSLGLDFQLNGFEPNVKNIEALLSIPKVKNIFNMQLEDVTEKFDLITIIHALEHIVDPIPFLIKISKKLNSNGTLLIEVPYYIDNPFDLLIADHCTHFTIPSLSAILAAAGLEATSIRTNVIDKELTVIAKLKQTDPTLLQSVEEEIIENNIKMVQTCLDWLETLRSDASAIAKRGHFGLFGTSISANWLFGELEPYIEFFVEEDKTRVGNLYYNRPIYHPMEIPSNTNAYMVLPRALAEKIKTRLQISQLCLPPIFHSK